MKYRTTLVEKQYRSQEWANGSIFYYFDRISISIYSTFMQGLNHRHYDAF